MLATAHLTEDEFQNYKNRKIPISELLTIGDHLAECKECSEKLGSVEERAAILEALRRDLQTAVLKADQHLAAVTAIESSSDPQQAAPKPIPIQNKFIAILPVVIGIGAVLLIFALLLTYLILQS
jgi:hypothetical protein